ncbi:MAG: hypothetical protein DCC68_22770 [Planctomycetota bacterium]|nr:MAG: hypothetical protein DCC68_22770 [Planctomycetota bacterium]
MPRVDPKSSLHVLGLAFIALVAFGATSAGDEPTKSDAYDKAPTVSIEPRIVDAQQAFLKAPTAENSQGLRQKIAWYLDREDADTALATLRKLRKRDAPHGDGLDLAMLAVASAYFEQGNRDRSAALLKEVIDRYPKSPTTSRAMLMLAELYGAKQDAKSYVHWLKRCAEFEMTEDTRTNLMDTDNTRSVAFQRLAAHYQNERDYLQAFKYWRAWSPRSWCGNCLMEMHEIRARRMSECIPHIDDHRFAVKCVLEDAIRFRGDYGQQRLVALYADADQLLDLLRIAGELAKREKQTAAERKIELDRIDTTSKFLQGAIVAETLRKSDDVHGLVRVLADKSFSAAVKEQVVAILAQGGDRVALAVEMAMRRSQAAERQWLLNALAANPSDGAFDALVKIAQSDIEFALNWYLVDSLAKRGERGLETVKRLTTHADPQRAKAARDLLARIDAAKNNPARDAAQRPVADAAKPDPASQPKPPAKPVHGSLPKTLADGLR